MAEELEEPGFDPARDSLAVWAGDQLVGYGQLRVALALDVEGRVRCSLGGGVHPEHRGRGLGRALMEKMERRADELAAERHPGRPWFFRADGGVSEADPVRRLLEHRGYRPVRWFNEMERPLDGPLPEVPVPDGVRLVRPDDELCEPVRAAHNRAFLDHWGSTEQTAETWAQHWRSRTSRLDCSTVVLGARDEVLAYVLCAQWVERELYVNLVGTVPEARGRGLARAALAGTMAVAAASGRYDVIQLGVDSANPTGATRLYDSLGFTVDRTVPSYRLDRS
nr:GNAT family N-acetyltransferase [Auraticoccus cholistanensis]